jgi:hypothetical protein
MSDLTIAPLNTGHRIHDQERQGDYCDNQLSAILSKTDANLERANSEVAARNELGNG